MNKENLKTCRICLIEKSLEDFCIDRNSKDGKRNYCRICGSNLTKKYAQENPEKIKETRRNISDKTRRASNLRASNWYRDNFPKAQENQKKWATKNPEKRWISNLKIKYNLTVEDYNSLSLKQNDCCAICKIPKTQLNRKLFVDHCHDTGLIRGLLCNKCNTGLGMFNDNIECIRKAVQYLEEFPKNDF